MSTHIYKADSTQCIGYVAQPTGKNIGPGPYPVVMVAPAFKGLNDFTRSKADWLASLGYIGFAVDYYGEGRATHDEAEATDMMHVLQADRPTLLVRMQAALKAAAALPNADKTRIAAIGFCFGGKAVLDLARSGAPLCGIAPLHGVYDAPPSGSTKMNTSVLVLHGWDDPLASPDKTVALTAELTLHCADWQLLAFGHTGHAFTNPQAQDPDRGMQFAAPSNARAFLALEHFLVEQFSAKPNP